jgi:hypothetical protein
MSDDPHLPFAPRPTATPDDAPLAGGPSAPAPGMRDAIAAWTDLDLTSKLIIAGSAATLLITLVGIPFGAWDATDFVLMVLVAGVVAGLAAGLRTGEILANQLSLLELGAGAVLGVLSVANLLETLFDLDAPRGGIFGVLLAIGLAVAGVAVLVGGVRRNCGQPALVPADDRWILVTLAGLGLVLLGWAVNLTISYWTMAQAGLSLAVLTLAALLVLVSRRIESPVPAAWAGVVLAAFGALLAVGQWGDLMSLGARTSLGPVDILAFFVGAVGIIAIIAGGVMTALEQGARQASGGGLDAL